MVIQQYRHLTGTNYRSCRSDKVEGRIVECSLLATRSP
uniref:Uncharacterized protein n=1 Tax=Arundo donax TaxID=35708 RepID=A0A0A9AGH7_ARUDO